MKSLLLGLFALLLHRISDEFSKLSISRRKPLCNTFTRFLPIKSSWSRPRRWVYIAKLVCINTTFLLCHEENFFLSTLPHPAQGLNSIGVQFTLILFSHSVFSQICRMLLLYVTCSQVWHEHLGPAFRREGFGYLRGAQLRENILTCKSCPNLIKTRHILLHT